jgi:hypothetical protein
MTTKITMAALILAVVSGALATAAEAHKFAPPPGGLHPPQRGAHACDETIGCLPPVSCHFPCPPPRGLSIGRYQTSRIRMPAVQ